MPDHAKMPRMITDEQGQRITDAIRDALRAASLDTERPIVEAARDCISAVLGRCLATGDAIPALSEDPYGFFAAVSNRAMFRLDMHDVELSPQTSAKIRDTISVICGSIAESYLYEMSAARFWAAVDEMKGD